MKKRTFNGFGAVVIGLAWLLGCQSGGPKVEKKIGAAGGAVEAADGTSVTIPEGALTEDVTVSLSLIVNAQMPRGATLLSPVYLMSPEGQQFTKPVRVKLPWTASRLPMGKTENDVQLYWSGNVPNALLAAVPNRQISGGFVEADVTHFSLFLVAAPDTPGQNPGPTPDGGMIMCGLDMEMTPNCVQCLKDNCGNQYTTCYGANWDKGDATGGDCGSFNRCNCDCAGNESCLETCMANLPPACTTCKDAVTSCNIDKCLQICSM